MPRNYHVAKDMVVAAMPGTQADLVAKTGLDRNTVGRWITVMRMRGESHIIAWRRPKTTGPFVPVHAAGAGKDKRCQLKKISRAQHWKHYVAKKRKEEVDAIARRSRTYYWRTKAEKRGDPLVNALFGKTPQT